MWDCQKKLIAIDLDGTLLDDQLRPGEKSIKAITLLSKMGVSFCFASGRNMSELKPIIEMVPGVAHSIALNGADIIDNHRLSVMASSHISSKTLFKAYERIKDLNVLYELCTPFSILSEKRLLDEIDSFNLGPITSVVKNTRTAVDSIEEIMHNPLYSNFSKVNMFFKTPELQNEARRRLSGFGYPLFFQNPQNLEINQIGTDKGSGVRRLAEYLDITCENIIVFGDNRNDIPMFKCAGLGIAMKNSIPEVLNLATYITEDNNHDGVFFALKKIFSIDEEGL